MTRGQTHPTVLLPSRREVLLASAAALLVAREALAKEADAAASTQPARAGATQSAEQRLGKLRVEQILFLGNSITLHPPAPQIGWTGNWGMAATAEDKDYVHLLLSRLKQQVGVEPRSRIRNIADFERGYRTFDLMGELQALPAFQPDVIIVAIGENVPALANDADRAAFSKAMSLTLKKLLADHQSTLFVRSCFWPDASKDAILKATCVEAGGTFVDISGLAKDESNFARSERKIEHAGVGAHPGDTGMRAIADAIWSAMAQQAGIAVGTGK